MDFQVKWMKAYLLIKTGFPKIYNVKYNMNVKFIYSGVSKLLNIKKC